LLLEITASGEVESVAKAARTGEMADGKLFTLPVEQVVRIRTGEQGDTHFGQGSPMNVRFGTQFDSLFRAICWGEASQNG
jgi:hypothetical protein